MPLAHLVRSAPWWDQWAVGPVSDQPAARDRMSDQEVRRRARAIIEEMGLSDHDLDQLFLAANVTADSHQTQAYRLWLDGYPASPDIDPRRLLRLLGMRQRRRAEGNEL